MEKLNHRILLDEPIEVFQGRNPDIVGRHYVNLCMWLGDNCLPLSEGEEISYIKSELPNGNTRVQLVYYFK